MKQTALLKRVEERFLLRVNFEENGAERKKLDGELRDYELNRQKSLKEKLEG